MAALALSYMLSSGVLSAVATATRKPPMGWNSWDCFQGNLNETGALEVASVMRTYLLPSGYDTLTIDEFWYKGDCKEGSGCIDAHGDRNLTQPNGRLQRVERASNRLSTKYTPWA